MAANKFDISAEEMTSLLDKAGAEDGRTAISADGTEERDSLTTFLFKTYDSIATGICWLLYGLHHDTSVPLWASLLATLLETFQWLSFAFFPTAHVQWSSSWTSRFARALDYASNFFGQSIAGFITACAWVGMIVILALLAVYAQKHLRWIWPMRLFRLWVVLGVSILFLPVAGALTRMLLGCLHVGGKQPFFPSLTCWDSTHIIYAVISAVLLPFFVFSTCIVAVCFFELNPNQRADAGDRVSASARVNARGDLLNVLARTTLLLCFSAFGSFDSARWPLCFALIFVGGLLLWYQIVHMPYYNLSVQTGTVFQALVIVWSGICMFVTNIRGDDGRGSTYLLYFCIPVLLLLAIVAVRARVDQILYWSNDHLTAPYLVELKARMFMMDGMHKASLDEAWVDHSDEHSNSVRKLLWREVEVIFQLGVSRFPDDPMLHMAFSAFYLFYTYNKPLAYRELASAGAVPHAFDVFFMLFLYSTRAELETSWGHSSDVQSYIEFKERKTVADNASSLAARSMFDFWTELLRSSPNVTRLIRLGNIGRSAVQQAQINFERLLQINAVSVPVLRAYGGFMIDFHGDLATSSQLLHRADELEDARATMVSADLAGMSFLDQQTNALDIFDERNAVCGMSVEKDRFAAILSLNASCRRMFGYAVSSELLGKNVSTMIPDPIQTMHDDIVKEFLSRNQTSIMNTTRVVLALHKAGHIFPINLFIRWADTSASKVIGVMSNLQTQDEQMMFDRENGACVTYVMQNVYSWFGFTRDMLIAREVFLGALFPHLSNENATSGKEKRRRELLFHKAMSRSGVLLAACHHTTGKLFVLKIWMTCVLVRNHEVSFIRMSKNVTPEMLRGDENVLHFTTADLAGEGALAHDAAYMFAAMSDARRLGGINTGVPATPAAAAAASAVSSDSSDDSSSSDDSRRRRHRKRDKRRKNKSKSKSKRRKEKRDSESESKTATDPAPPLADVMHFNYGTQIKPTLPDFRTSANGSSAPAGQEGDTGSETDTESEVSDDQRHRRRDRDRESRSRRSKGSRRSRSRRSRSRRNRSSSTDSDSDSSDSDSSSSSSEAETRRSGKIGHRDAAAVARSQMSNEDASAAAAIAAANGENIAMLRAQNVRMTAKQRADAAAAAAADAAEANAVHELPVAGKDTKTKAQMRIETSAALTMAYAKKSKNRRVRNALAALRRERGGATNAANVSSGPESGNEQFRGLGERMAESDRESHGESINSDGSQVSGALSSTSSMLGSEAAGVGTAGHRLINTFIGDETRDLKKRLSRASRFALLACFVVFACWLAMFLVTSNAMSSNDSGYRLLTLAGHRRHVAFSIVACTRSLELIRLGVFDAAREAPTRLELEQNVAIFASLEEVLYDDSLISRSSRDFFYVPSIVLTSLVGSTEIDRVFNLKEAGQAFLAAASRAALAPLADVNQVTNGAVFFVIRNGPGPLLDALTKGALAFKGGLDAIYKSVWTIQIVTYGIALLVVILFIVFVLRPTVAVVEEGSANILKLFLALPRPVVRLLQRRFLQALRNQGDDEEDDEDAAVAGRDRGADYADDVSDADSSLSGISVDSDNDRIGGKIMSINGNGTDTDPGNTNSVDGATPGTNDAKYRSADVSAVRLSSLNAMHVLMMRTLAVKYAFLLLYCIAYTVIMIVVTFQFFEDNVNFSDSLVGSANRHVATAQMSYYTIESIFNPRVTSTDLLMADDHILDPSTANRRRPALPELTPMEARDEALLQLSAHDATVMNDPLDASYAPETMDDPSYIPAAEMARRTRHASLSRAVRRVADSAAAAAATKSAATDAAAFVELETSVAAASPVLEDTVNLHEGKPDEDGSVVAHPPSATELWAPSALDVPRAFRSGVRRTDGIYAFDEDAEVQAMPPAALPLPKIRPGAINALLQPRSSVGLVRTNDGKRILTSRSAARSTAVSPKGSFHTLAQTPKTVFEEVKSNPGNHATYLAQKAFFTAVNFSRGLVYSDPALELDGVLSSSQNALLYGDLCSIYTGLDSQQKAAIEAVVTAATRAQFVAECPTFFNGANKHGMLPVNTVTQSYTQQLVAFDKAGLLSSMYPYQTVPPYDSYDPADLNENFTPLPPTSAPATDLLTIMMSIQELIAKSLQVSMSLGTNDYRFSAMRNSNAYDTLREVLLICFVVLLFLFHLVLYHPIFSTLNEGAQQTMSLLLIIPPDVVSKVQHIHAFVRSVSKKK